MSANSEIRLEGVIKHYGKVTALKPLDLTIESGQLVTLLGPSGCGKTTLLRLIAGLESVSEGKIFIGGKDVTNLSAAARNISMVFQSYALFPHLSVLDNVCFGLISSGVSKKESITRAEETLKQVGLAGFGARLPSELSGGQQQRVAVARALVLEPDVLLFDEPLSNLDARLRRQMRNEIRELQQRLGLTVVYVTHDQSEALAVSDKIVVMKAAEIAQIGTPEQLYAAPYSVFVAGFMGEANHLKGEIISKSGALANVKLGSLTMQLPHHDLPIGAASVILRPEAIYFADAQPAAIKSTSQQALNGIIKTAIFMGAVYEYSITTELGDVFAIIPANTPIKPVGTKVALACEPRGVVLVRP